MNKIRILVFLIFGATLLFVNCEKDTTLDIDTPQQTSKYKIHTLNQEQIQSNVQIVNKLKSFNNTKSTKETKSEAREIYNSEYNFTINTDYVKYLENTETNYHSYSFPITRDTIPEDNKVENLLLSLNEDGTYSAFILKYDFTKEEYATITQSILETRTTTYTPIDFDTSVFYNGEFAKLVYECVEIWEWVMIDPGDEGQLVGADEAEQWTMGWALTGLSCGFYDDGTSGTSTTGTTNTNSDGDAAGGSPDGTDQTTNEETDLNDEHGEFASSPAIEDQGIDQNHLNNCNELHKFSTESAIVEKIDELKNSLNDNIEKGHFIRANPNSPYFTTLATQANDDCLNIRMSKNVLVYAMIHTHPTGCNGSQPMFGPGDLHSLYSLSQTFDPSLLPELGLGTKSLAIYMIVPDYIYAIKIDDLNKINKLGEIFNIRNEDGTINEVRKRRRDKFSKDLEDKYDKVSNSGTSVGSHFNLAEKLIKFIDNKDLGISIYNSKLSDINYDPNKPQDMQTSNWRKFILKENGELDINSNPCNN